MDMQNVVRRIESRYYKIFLFGILHKRKTRHDIFGGKHGQRLVTQDITSRKFQTSQHLGRLDLPQTTNFTKPFKRRHLSFFGQELRQMPGKFENIAILAATPENQRQKFFVGHGGGPHFFNLFTGHHVFHRGRRYIKAVYRRLLGGNYRILSHKDPFLKVYTLYTCFWEKMGKMR